MDVLTRLLIALVPVAVSISLLGADRPAVAQLPDSETTASQPLLLSQALSGTLQLQDSGSAVEQLQSQLTALGYYDGPITGFFGTLTEDAVIRFQQAAGLEADGVVGAETQAALQRSTSTSQSFNPSAPSVDDGLLRLDDQGDRVTALQNRLQELNYYTGPITGFFGSLTEDAVIRFQQGNGLTPDGIVGSDTQNALGRNGRQATLPAVPIPQTSSTVPIPQTSFGLDTPTATSSPTLRRGDEGTAVATLQTRLRELGFYRGTVTGQFDAQTEAAVIEYQRSRGLEADGIVGGQTASALNLATLPETEDGRYSVLELQRRLRDLRLYAGPLDGRLGPETRTAIQAAQARFNVSEGDIVNGRF